MEKTTNIVYTSMINSVRQLVKLIVEYLTTEKNLVISDYFHIPCNELVRRQFSPSHEARKSAELFTGNLMTKRTLISCDTRTNNDHAQYCAAQRLLLKFVFSLIHCLLEEA